MEQIPTLPQSQQADQLRRIKIRGPAYLKLAFMLLVGFAVATVFTRTLAQTAPPPANPFLAYADIFPGQPASAIEVRKFSCPDDPYYYNNYFGVYCISTAEDEIFSQIAVIASRGMISSIIFTPRDHTLTVGDLEMFLGVAIDYKYPPPVFFTLSDENIRVQASTIAYTCQFSLFLPLRNITFSEASMPLS